MFRFKSLHVGQEIEKDYMIAIEDIREPGNPTVNPFGSFTVAIKNNWLVKASSDMLDVT